MNKDKNENSLDYDFIVEEALRSVVKRSLEIVVSKGLKNEHHFFISFNAKYPGVIVPPELTKNNEDEIKIILQHQFWDLIPEKEKFSVTLSFDGKKKKIVVPYNAIFSFSDPSVGFGLQFKNNFMVDDINIVSKSDIEKNVDKKKATPKKKNAEIVSLDTFRTKNKNK